VGGNDGSDGRDGMGWDGCILLGEGGVGWIGDGDELKDGRIVRGRDSIWPAGGFLKE